MEHILEIKKTDVLSYITNLESDSIHAITADHEIDDLVAQESYRILKKGGFIFVMSLPNQMYHNGGILIQNKFKIIDSIHWLQTDKPDNSFTVEFLIERMNYLSDIEKNTIKEDLKGMRIPKLRRCHIPIIVAQKPPSKNQTLNHFDNRVGLINQQLTASGKTAGNIFTTEFDICPYYFLLPRIKHFEKELFARAWSHILSQFTIDESIILDITKGHQAVLPCLYLDRRYKACMPTKLFEGFLHKCASFLKMKQNQRDKWSINF